MITSDVATFSRRDLEVVVAADGATAEIRIGTSRAIVVIAVLNTTNEQHRKTELCALAKLLEQALLQVRPP